MAVVTGLVGGSAVPGELLSLGPSETPRSGVAAVSGWWGSPRRAETSVPGLVGGPRFGGTAFSGRWGIPRYPVPTLELLPWAVFCYGGPVFSLLRAAGFDRTGLGLRRLEEET